MVVKNALIRMKSQNRNKMYYSSFANHSIGLIIGSITSLTKYLTHSTGLPQDTFDSIAGHAKNKIITADPYHPAAVNLQNG